MALTIYTSFAKKLADNDIDWVADTVKLYIATNAGYTVSAAHDFADDLAGEVSGTNYNAGGMTLANKTSSAANPCLLTADDIVIAQSGGGFSNGRKYIAYKDTAGAASTDPLIAYGAAAGDFGNLSGQLTIDFPTNFLSISV